MMAVSEAKQAWARREKAPATEVSALPRCTTLQKASEQILARSVNIRPNRRP